MSRCSVFTRKEGSIFSVMSALRAQPRNMSAYIQASVVAVPSSNSEQLERFCELNKETCPLLYLSETGDTTAGNLARGSDIRYAYVLNVLLWFNFYFGLKILKLSSIYFPFS